MTKIKFCGLSRTSDIEAVNKLKPEYVGFVFASESHRFITHKKAEKLKKLLSQDIQVVGVFVNERVDVVANLLNNGTLDIAQFHGEEDEAYIRQLKYLTGKSVIKAFCIKSEEEISKINTCSADYVLLDSGGGSGKAFDWRLIQNVKRPYFLAGGLNPDNVEKAIKKVHPYAVDVSSGIETDGKKDKKKMADFSAAVRKE